jgi:hypothetical protein
LKQLQLIQILDINVCTLRIAANAPAKAPGVNRLFPGRDSEKAASGNADTALLG